MKKDVKFSVYFWVFVAILFLAYFLFWSHDYLYLAGSMGLLIVALGRFRDNNFLFWSGAAIFTASIILQFL
ncbi:hypothetical protein [Alkalimonas amylolytica]|uniref:hypothetical protein n=1 Tax=Alkalimonas amylolytica TaxID=152573 RepID=UPI000B826EFE|nr:hypothetical protein [Alkalimonas amylolytica]